MKKLFKFLFVFYILFFIPKVYANDMFGGTLNQDISTPFRAMTDDTYGNYFQMPSNSAYFFYENAKVSANTTRVFCFEGDSYLQDKVYAITIYISTNTTNRVVPPPNSMRRIGLGNSMNAARVSYVNNNTYAIDSIYSNYSYDYFDIRYPVSTDSFNIQHLVYSITYFFVPNISGVGLAVPFAFNGSVSSSTTIYYLGYRLENLGDATNLSSSDIQSIISNSGLATSQSQNEIKSSLNTIKSEISGMQEEQQQTNDKLDDLNDNITNDDTSDAEDEAGSFFSGFTTDTHGLTSIITAPLELIGNITSSTCSSLELPLPYIDEDLVLPCMSSIYEEYFGDFFDIYQMITFGIISYWVLVRIFNLVKDFKNPDHDEIEVLDL